MIIAALRSFGGSIIARITADRKVIVPWLASVTTSSGEKVIVHAHTEAGFEIACNMRPDSRSRA